MARDPNPVGAKPLVKVNVDTGFLVTFAPAFTRRYGEGSLFVRAASDVLTLRLAAIMRDSGRLVPPDAIALFASPAAVEAVKQLLACLPEGAKHLLWEALGSKEIGSLKESVDAALGKG